LLLLADAWRSEWPTIAELSKAELATPGLWW
jgi:hypothetical protein